MIPNEDELNAPAILAKLRARIAALESERADFDAALEAAHAAARKLQVRLDRSRADHETWVDHAFTYFEQRNAAQAEAAEARAAADSLAETVAAIARQRDAAIRDYEDASIELSGESALSRMTQAALDDMTRQRDELLRAAKWGISRLASLDPVNEHDGSNQLFEAVLYCEQLTPVDRARDAQQQDGQRAADAKPESGSAQWWADCDEIPY